MSLEKLKSQLIEAYSNENLNDLTKQIIGFYKNEDNYVLRLICEVVNIHFSFINIEDKKLFSKLILLYHPDKIAHYHKSINECTSDEALQKYAHIIPVLKNIDGFIEKSQTNVLPPRDFEEEYGWNYQPGESDYYVVREDDETVQGWFDEENTDEYFAQYQALPEGSFIEAVKRKIYGPMQINFPYHQLEDMEEIEMAEYEIIELTGIEYCTYVSVLDLSYNQIADISKLEHCSYIQELYLSNNNIYFVDALHYLPDLRVLDLSDNNIADITILLHNKSLEFVNLLGNPVSQIQIKQLKANGVVVVF